MLRKETKGNLLIVAISCCISFFAKAQKKFNSELVIDKVHIDSLVKNRLYAINNLLKVKDKESLIRELLKYRGDTRINPTWKSVRYAQRTANYSGGEYWPRYTSNEMTALFVIEATLRESITPENSFTGVTVECREDGIIDRENVFPYMRNTKKNNTNNEVDKKMIVNRCHIKKMFFFYKRWLSKNGYEAYKGEHPLENTKYRWKAIKHESDAPPQEPNGQ